MSVRASFQAIPSVLYEKVKERSPSGKVNDIKVLYPPKEEWKAVKETDPSETGFGAWWVFQMAFNRLGAPLINAIQGDLFYKNGIDTSGQEAFEGDHYMAYASVECVRHIAARLESLSIQELKAVLDLKNHYADLEKDLHVLRAFYHQAAQSEMAVMITIA